MRLFSGRSALARIRKAANDEQQWWPRPRGPLLLQQVLRGCPGWRGREGRRRQPGSHQQRVQSSPTSRVRLRQYVVDQERFIPDRGSCSGTLHVRDNFRKLEFLLKVCRKKLYYGCFKQCSGSVTFWCGSGFADLYRTYAESWIRIRILILLFSSKKRHQQKYSFSLFFFADYFGQY